MSGAEAAHPPIGLTIGALVVINVSEISIALDGSQLMLIRWVSPACNGFPPLRPRPPKTKDLQYCTSPSWPVSAFAFKYVNITNHDISKSSCN
jgi:hypothetical protein